MTHSFRFDFDYRHQVMDHCANIILDFINGRVESECYTPFLKILSTAGMLFIFILLCTKKRCMSLFLREKLVVVYFYN